MKNNLIKKFLSFSIGGYINILIGFFTVPITTRILSPEQYGISSLITTITSFMFVICCLGTEQGFVRFFYEEKEDNRGNLLSNCLFYPIFISLVVFVLIYILRDKISIFLLGHKEKNIWLTFIGMIFFSSLNNFSLLIIRMQQKGKLYSFFNVLSKSLEFFFILILYKLYGDNYKTLIFATLYSLILVVTISIIIEKNIWKFKGKAKTDKKEILLYSLPLTLTMALNWVFGSSDKIIIKMLSNTTELGLYSGAFKIIALLSVLQSGFTTFWTPVSLEHYIENPGDLSFYKKANDYLSLIFFSIGIGILMFRNIIILLLGEKYYEAIYIMPMLTLMPIMYLLSETTHIGISFKKKTNYYLYISIIVAIVNLIGNIILIPSLGAKGAGISTGISYILFFSLKTYFSIKLINFKFELKKVYFSVFLILIYTLILSFYDNVFFTLISGIIIEIIILIVYYPTLKEIYFNYFERQK